MCTTLPSICAGAGVLSSGLFVCVPVMQTHASPTENPEVQSREIVVRRKTMLKMMERLL